jgi:glycosyltransferase involved in cell wall biosynthesis
VSELSIIIPAYRAENTLERTITSVLKQRVPGCQLIVVEDGVFDDTASVVGKYPSVKHIQLSANQGACYARNTGISSANGEYVMFLDADDYIEGQLFLKNMLETIKSKQTSLVLGRCKKLWEVTGKTWEFIPPENETAIRLLFRWLCGQSGPAPCSVIWKKSEIERIGGWDESFSKNQDGELMMRAMLSGCTLTQSYEGAGVYVQHEGERVSDRADDKAFECLARIEEYINKTLPAEQKAILEPALATYQLQVGLRALTFNRPDIAQAWLQRWSISRSELGLRALKQLGIKYTLLNLLCVFLGPSRFLKLRKSIAS